MSYASLLPGRRLMRVYRSADVDNGRLAPWSAVLTRRRSCPIRRVLRSDGG
jgi:hypothetical protein